MSISTPVLILTIVSLLFMGLWWRARTDAWDQEDLIDHIVFTTNRETVIALSYIAQMQPMAAYHFAQLYLVADSIGINRHFPDFAAFRARELEEDKQGGDAS